MSKRLLLSAVSVLLIAFGSATTVWAQGSTGLVDGEIVDASGNGVAGVVITLSSSRTGLTRTVTTNDSGNFKMQLPPGAYELKSSKSGYSSIVIDQVMVNLGVTTNLAIPVKDDAIEVITTYGSATTLMPATTGETGLNISLEELSQVPVARNIEAVALLAPGTVAGDNAFGDDKTLVSFGGASVAENVYYIDGLNVTNFRNGLGGSSVPFEFYDQFQIKTGGYGAEFGRSVGGVINAVTKRGSNEWEYGVVTYSETSLAQGTSPNTILADGTLYDLNSENEQTSFVTDIYVGGPIIKDKLFFYALYEPGEEDSASNSRGGPQTFNEQNIDDAFYGGNLTWNITDNHSLSATAFTDEREIVITSFDFDVDSKTKGEEIGSQTQFRGGDNKIVRYDGNITENLVVSAMWGENEYNLTSLSTNDISCPLVIDLRDQSDNSTPGCWVGSGQVQVGGDKREAIRFDIEWYVGDHTIRAGYDDEENSSEDAAVYQGIGYTPEPSGAYYRYETYDVNEELPNGGIMPDANGDGSRVDTVRFRSISNGGSFSTTSTAWYIEDTWDINDAFKASFGIRNEEFINNNAEGLPFIEVTDQWAPRVALEWSPGGTGESVVSVNWGRYHLPIAANTNVRLSGAELDFRRYFIDDGLRDENSAPASLDANGIPTGLEVGQLEFTADGTVPDTSAIVDSTLDPMFQDEWILAYERQVNDNWTAGIRYINRKLSSTIDDAIFDYALEAINWDGPIGSSNDCHYVLVNPGTNTTTFCEAWNIPGDDTSGTYLQEVSVTGPQTGFPEAERTYEAWEITFEGAMANWNVQGSYTWSKNEGNTEGLVKSDIGQDDAGITQDFDIPQLMDGAFGFLPNDRRHKLKLWASYQASDNLTLSTNMLLQSGRPINAFGTGHPDGTPSYGDTFYLTTDVGDPDNGIPASFLFVPRGTAGRMPWVTRIDLAAIYSMNLGDRADLELRAEVFNVLNADSATDVYEFPEIAADQFRFPTSFQRPRYVRIGAALRFR